MLTRFLRRSVERRPVVRFSPLGPVVPLEDRINPVNLQLTSLQVVDAFNIPQTAPVYGQMLFVRAGFNGLDMLGGEQTRVRYTASFAAGYYTNNPAVSIPADGGTFAYPNPGNYFGGTWYRGGWYVGTAAFTITATIDPDNTIVETDETDNSFTITVTPTAPVNLPALFTQPIGGTPNRDWSITNYADIDPRANQRRDYRWGGYQYDGHNAIDAGPPTFAYQDAGVTLHAVAAGTVSRVDGPGFFDRETSWNGGQNWNGITIDHGSGWQTVYGHLATNTATVRVGDPVYAGQVIGLMGSSGVSTGTHIHYTATFRGAPVEVGLSPASYWADPLPYAGQVPGFYLDAGVTNFDPFSVAGEYQEKPAQYTSVGTTAPGGNLMYFYVNGYNLKATDTMYFRWVRPDGTILNTSSFSPNGNYSYSTWWWSRPQSAFQGMTGTWQVIYYLNGTTPAQEQRRVTFDVVTGSGAGNLRASMAGVGILIDGRTTAIPFSNTQNTQRTVALQNVGTGPLTIANIRLPDGFAVVSTPVAAIPGGQTGNLVIAFTETAPGLRRFDTLRFDTNDPDIGEFELLLSGSVSGTAPSNPSLAFTGSVAASYNRGAVPKLLDATTTLATSAAANGVITVAFRGFAGPDDRLGLRTTGTGPGQVSVGGNEVSVGGVVMGTFSGGSASDPLVVTLNAAATPAAAQAILRAVTYHNVSPDATTLRKLVEYQFTDGTGVASYPAYRLVVNTGVRRDPVAASLADRAIVQGTSLVQAGSFSDSWGGNHTATVDYGDGTGPQPLPVSGTTFTLNHLYTAPPGSYTVTVTIVNDQGGQITTTHTVTVEPLAVSGFTINGGLAQRSRVTELSVEFNAIVTADAGAFTLRRVALPGGLPGDNLVVTATANLQTVDGRTRATLTFAAQTGVDFGSLADGRWELTASGSAIRTAEGNVPMPANVLVGTVRRLFGDVNGNGAVNAADASQMRLATGTVLGQTGYNPALDWNGNGAINAADSAAFRVRLGLSI